MFKKFIAYLICLTTPKSIVEAINDAAAVSELDNVVLREAGVRRDT